MATPLLALAANGRTWLTFEEYDTPQWRIAREWLAANSFVESGAAVLGVDEGILPSLVRGDISIAVGFDNWSGTYLLAESSEGDRLLVELAQLVAAEDRRSVA